MTALGPATLGAPIPLTTVETAFLLASVRRAARRPDAIPLGPIRSLHYFLPVIEELLHTPLHTARPISPTYAAKFPCLRTGKRYL